MIVRLNLNIYHIWYKRVNIVQNEYFDLVIHVCQLVTLFILTPILSVMHLRFACCIVAVVTCQVFYAAMNAVDKSMTMSECD